MKDLPLLNSYLWLDDTDRWMQSGRGAARHSRRIRAEGESFGPPWAARTQCVRLWAGRAALPAARGPVR